MGIAMTKLIVLIYACVIVPAAYAGLLVFVIGSAFPNMIGERVAKFAVLIALPLVISGAVKWWDVCYPSDPVGWGWGKVLPGQFVAGSCIVHGFVLLGVLLLHLVMDMGRHHIQKIQLSKITSVDESIKLELQDINAREKHLGDMKQFTDWSAAIEKRNHYKQLSENEYRFRKTHEEHRASLAEQEENIQKESQKIKQLEMDFGDIEKAKLWKAANERLSELKKKRQEFNNEMEAMDVSKLKAVSLVLLFISAICTSLYVPCKIDDRKTQT